MNDAGCALIVVSTVVEVPYHILCTTPTILLLFSTDDTNRGCQLTSEKENEKKNFFQKI